MDNHEVSRDERREQYLEEVIKAFERELDTARDLNKQHSDTMRRSRRRDEQVLIERRREPR